MGRIASVYGLESYGWWTLEFPNKVYGMALNLEEEMVGAVILGDDRIKEGDIAMRTGNIVQVPAGEADR